MALYKDIIDSKGEKNIRRVLNSRNRLFVSASEYPYHTGLIYEEWIKLPEEQRTHIVIPDNTDKAVLMFRVMDINDEGQDFFLRTNLKFRNAWPSDKSYESGSTKGEIISSESGQGSIFSKRESIEQTRDDNDSEQRFNLTDRDQLKQFVSNNASEKGTNGGGIPGSIEPEGSPENVRRGLNSKIRSLSRALKAACKIVFVWTDMLTTDAMARSLMYDYTPNVSMHKKEITTVISQNVLFYKDDDSGEATELTSGQEYIDVVEDLGLRVTKILEGKAKNLFPYLRENALELSNRPDLNSKIAEGLIIEAIDQAEAEVESYYFDYDDNDLVRVSQVLIRNQSLVQELTYGGPGFEKKVKERDLYTSQIILVAYAEYLADLLSQIYNKSLKPPVSGSSYPNYIGYDIGIDLSSREKIIGFYKDGEWIRGITKEGLDSIPRDSKDMNPVKALRLATDISSKIDQIYKELSDGMALSSYYALNPSTLAASRDYLASRFSNITGESFDRAKTSLEAALPVKTFTFSGKIGSPETTPLALPYKRKPIISKGLGIDDFPGSKSKVRYTVTDKLQPYDRSDKSLVYKRVFLTKAEAESFAEELEASNPDWKSLIPSKVTSINKRTVLDTVSYTVNPELNYDGSMTQIGMFGDKSLEVLDWPPPSAGWSSDVKPGFVGLMLPLAFTNVQYNKTVSQLKELMIADYNIVIDAYGKDLDISILFKRGSTDKERASLFGREKKILKLRKELDKVISDEWANSHGRAGVGDVLKDNRDKAYDSYYQQTDKILKDISSLKLAIRVAGTYYRKSGGKKDARAMPVLVLEDPVRCYHLIQNPEIRGIELDQDARDRLISFVIDVYNVDGVRDMVREYTGNYNLTSEDILRNKKEEVRSPKRRSTKHKKHIKVMMRGNSWIDHSDEEKPVERPSWKLQPGKYFNILPSTKDDSSNTYVSYIHDSFPEGKPLAAGAHPTVEDLISKIQTMQVIGLIDYKKDKADAPRLLEKAEAAMLKYIKKATAGGPVNEALDGQIDGDSKKRNISKRRKELERMMFSMGVVDFGDRELPNY